MPLRATLPLNGLHFDFDKATMRPGNPVTSARVDSCPAATTHNVCLPSTETCPLCRFPRVRSVPSALKFSFMVWKIVLWERNHERFRPSDDEPGKTGWINLRQAVSTVSAFLLRNRILVLTIIFCAAWQVPCGISRACRRNLSNHQPCKPCPSMPTSLKELRKLYTSEVTDRLVGHGIQVTHDYATKEGAIPLPATFSMELGKRISTEA